MSSSISETAPEQDQSKITTASSSTSSSLSIPEISGHHPVEQYDAEFAKRVMRNYANAAIINLEEGNGIKAELGFSSSQWSWSQSIFSYSYMLFEPTNTILLKKITPSKWMFIIILAWGICATSSGAAQNFPGMMVVRSAIGLAEAGFYPSVLYHMAFWYKPSEMPWRVALFYSLGQLSSALSGLLAYAISFMNRLGGLSGWRWLFILEGLPAIILAFVALWAPDYPETAKMLTPEEREWVANRLANTAPRGKDRSWSWQHIKQLFRSSTLYTFSIYWIGHGIGGFGVNYALPTVIYELGFTTTAKSQLMNIVVGHCLHKKWIRPWTTAVAIETTIIVCYIILITVSKPVVKYIALIVATACAGSAYPVIWPERIRALEGTVAAGIGIGLTNAMAQFSGICGPHVYNSRFGPTYRVSYIICLVFLCIAISGILVSWVLVRRNDRRKDKRVVSDALEAEESPFRGEGDGGKEGTRAAG
ncbi:major facilitator superfamily domain-containing protein [Aspergillus foveolatus]|uniref:major facilitator superfamily domain-containing protein n=1 Tax=Aspergillus foveolatus TaxID=210207 RepID=UPI003CCD373E